MGMEDLNHELQRLKDSRSIPDLNNDVEDGGEGKASLSKTEDKDLAGERGCVSITTQGGKQLGGSIPNPHQWNNTEESMDVNGVQGRCSEDEACHGGGASQRTS
uniref:Uncharacterized protein n=1 Tax=Arundo donax TaxID=35708 RepID=A0A0A9BFJ8_ARUDO